jgi:hypothetical protein
MPVICRIRKACLYAVILFVNISIAEAQNNRGNDTAYYVYFPNSITARFYTSQKYTQFGLKNKGAPDLNYLPNTTFNLGVGATYHNFTLNLAYGFGFLNPNKQTNKTNYIDLQGHFYQPKWVSDFEGQFYKGFHLSPGFLANAGNNYYRNDLRVTLLGMSHYYIFNSKKFSYRASFKQNEWQKKSAGTFLAGAEIYYGVIKADSSLIPKSIQVKYPQKSLDKINYMSIGPGVGYAYTQILAHHIFLTASVTGNLNFGLADEHLMDHHGSNFFIKPVTRFRFAAGYNGRSWNISANWITDNLPFSGTLKNTGYRFNTGNYRIVIAKRFYPGPRLQKRLQILDKIFKE